MSIKASIKAQTKTFTALSAILVLLSGCQTSTAVRQDITTEATIAASDQQKTETTAANDVAPVIKPFTKEGLYQLLVAEMSGMRGDLNVALANYVEQAHQTKDTEIISRAMRIAVYMNATEQQIDMASLFIELQPDNLEARRILALNLARKGALLDAFPHAIYCLEQQDAEPLMTLSVLAANSTRTSRQELLDRYPAQRARLPGIAELPLSQAMLLRQQELPEQALEQVRRSLELDPTSETATLLIVQLLHQKGEKQQARSYLEKAIADQPDNKRLRIQLVRFIASDDLPLAKSLLEELANDFPDDAELNLTLAAINKELGLIEQAKVIYESLLQHRTAAVTAHFQLGLIAEQEGLIEQALLHYRQVRSGNNFINAAVRVSHLLARHNQLDTAQIYLSQLRTAAPQQAAMLFQVESELLVSLQKNEDAFKVLSSAIDLYPDNVTLLYTRSVVGEKLDAIDQAEQDLRAILALDAENAAALNALGYTLTIHSTRYEEAHQLILQALELNPGDPATLDSLGWVLYRMGKPQQALVHLRAAYASLQDPEVAAHLGEVLWVTGEKEEAQRIWDQSLSENPDNAIILDTIKRLLPTRTDTVE